MKKQFLKITPILVLVCLLFLSGCATNRSVISLDIAGDGTNLPSNGKQVFFQSVTDNRQFQENPKTQDIPSLGFGGANAATNELKKRAIGRKRNGYGKALGDILLEEGKTVESVVGDALERAFAEMGYKVIGNKEEVTAGTIVIDTSIEKFWAYMTPGFWAITLSSDISTDLALSYQEKGETKQEKISVTAEGKYQVATETNWMEIVKRSLEKFIAQTKKSFTEQI